MTAERTYVIKQDRPVQGLKEIAHTDSNRINPKKKTGIHIRKTETDGA